MEKSTLTYRSRFDRFLTFLVIGLFAYSLFESLGVLIKTRDLLGYVFLFPYGAIRVFGVFVFAFLFFAFYKEFKLKSGAMFLFVFGLDNALTSALSGNFFQNEIWTLINLGYTGVMIFGLLMLGDFTLNFFYVILAGVLICIELRFTVSPYLGIIAFPLLMYASIYKGPLDKLVS